MVTEQEIKKELNNLINILDSIKEPITCKSAPEIRELSHELARKIHDKIEPDNESFVDINY